MTHEIRRISERLAAHAEAVCAHYLSNGQKAGRYWLVGDVFNTKGRSLWVRLHGPLSGPGAAGNWTDEATGDFGDLIDLIRLNRQLNGWAEVRDEVMGFLSEPRHVSRQSPAPAPRNSPEAARRLFAASTPIRGTLAAKYLEARGLTLAFADTALRFHPSCYYRAGDHAALTRIPALIAGITDLGGDVRAVLRTYLAEDGLDKAPLRNPRLVLGDQLGNAVRVGSAQDVLLVGEGLETMLSLRQLVPHLPINAALSANHLAALKLPPRLKRLYIAADNDTPGRAAAQTLIGRVIDDVMHIRLLLPARDDWNSDLREDGAALTLQRILEQLAPEDLPARAV